MKTFDVYLAGPYSHSDPAVRQERFEQLTAYAAKLMKETPGLSVFSPITHSHPLQQHGMEGSWQHWKDVDTRILKNCEKLYVLMLPGWHGSIGVNAEIQIAKDNGIEIILCLPHELMESPV